MIFLDPIQLLRSLLLGFSSQGNEVGWTQFLNLKEALTVIYQFGKDLVWLFSGEGDNFCAVFNSYPAAVLTFNTHQVQEGVIMYLTF